MKPSFTTLSNILTKLDPVRNGRDISNEELFRAFGKKPDSKADSNHVDNKVSELKRAGAVIVYHTDVFPRRRTHVTLTNKAMDILEGRVTQAGQNSVSQSAPKPADSPDKPMTISEKIEMIKQWNRDDRDWRIDFSPEYIGEKVAAK